MRKSDEEKMCQKLAKDKNCYRKDNGFQCQQPSSFGDRFFNDSFCEKVVGKILGYDVIEYKSLKIGQKLMMNQLSILFKNVPRKNCQGLLCGYFTENNLEEFRNSCRNCMEPEFVTTKLTLELMPIGTYFKVIDSYKLKREKLDGYESYKMLVIESSTGDKAEISELGFELLLRGDRKFLTKYESEVLEDIARLKREKKVGKKDCFSYLGSVNESKTNLQISKMMQDKYNKFILDFDLSYDVELKGFDEGTSGRYKTFCADVTFRTESSYLLAHYYLQEWGLQRFKN